MLSENGPPICGRPYDLRPFSFSFGKKLVGWLRNTETSLRITHPALQQVVSSHGESKTPNQLPQEQIKLQKSALIPNSQVRSSFVHPLILRTHSAPLLYFAPATVNISDYVHAIFVCFLPSFALYGVYFDSKATVFAWHTVLQLKA